jgi:adapter protein MecA 1/2
MRVDKIASNKVRIFISYEDLAARGIDREELWHNGKKVQELFFDMMEIAYAEVGFEVVGPIAVEAFTMPTDGVVVIVTQVPSLPSQEGEAESAARPDAEDAARDPFDTFVFAFADFEDVVRTARSLAGFHHLFCSLYVYQNRYHLFFEDDAIDEEAYDTVWAVLHEYGDPVKVTRAMLDEYGSLISERYALQTIGRHFFD